MKKFIAILLALLMIVPFGLVSCGDDGPTPGGPVVPGGDTAGADDSEDPADTEKEDEPEEKIYEPDPDAQFTGSFAVVLNGNGYVDDIKAVSVKGKITLIDETFEETADFSAYTFKTATGGTWDGDAADWSIQTFETIENEGKSSEKVVVNNAAVFAGEADGAMLCFGESDWNMLQASLKVQLSEGSTVKLYFGITDDNNYYALNVSDEIYVEHCVDGTTTIDTIKLPFVPKYDEFFPLSVVEDANFVKVFVAGTQYFEAYKENNAASLYGGIGFGTWSTYYSIDNVKVTSNATGDVLYENDFENETLSDSVWQPFNAADGAWATLTDGGDWHTDWVITDDTTIDEASAHGNVLQVIGVITGGGIMLTESVGNSEWTDYTFEFDARKDGGAEGFMPYFAVVDVADPAKADYIRWNQGGWSNTLTCYQTCVEGSLTNGTQVSDVYTLGEWYHVSITVTSDNYIIGMVNGAPVNIKIG